MYRLRQFLRQIRQHRAQGAGLAQLRYFGRWKRALEGGSTSMQDRLPWISFPALDRLKELVKPTDKVFEYGGGGSTLFWCDHVSEVVTVEHDAAWFEQLRKAMERETKAKWTGRMVQPERRDLVDRPDPADPRHFASADAPSMGSNYKAYVEVIDDFPDDHFDVVLIDGRARTSCLRKSVPKLRKGGLLVLDNAEREYYTRNNGGVLAGLLTELSGMAPVIYSPDFSETRIYRKV